VDAGTDEAVDVSKNLFLGSVKTGVVVGNLAGIGSVAFLGYSLKGTPSEVFVYWVGKRVDFSLVVFDYSKPWSQLVGSIIALCVIASRR